MGAGSANNTNHSRSGRCHSPAPACRGCNLQRRILGAGNDNIARYGVTRLRSDDSWHLPMVVDVGRQQQSRKMDELGDDETLRACDRPRAADREAKSYERRYELIPRRSAQVDLSTCSPVAIALAVENEVNPSFILGGGAHM